MAEETQKPAAAATPEAPSTTEEVVVVEKPVTEKEPVPAPEPEPEAPEKPAAPEKAGEVAIEEAVVEALKEEEKPKVETEEAKISQSVSFKEETNVVGDLPEAQKKALDELKVLIQETLNKHEFTDPPPPPPVKEEEKVAEPEKPEEPPTTSDAAPSDEAPKPVETESETAAPVEEVKEEEKVDVKEETKEVAEVVPPVVAEEVVVSKVAEEVVVSKVATVDEDGAKTVEAIEETVVAVSTPVPAVEETPAPAKEAEAEAETKTEETPAPPPPPPEEVFIWGIPILGDEKSDVILLKFLRARDFKVKEAFTMIKNTVRWRKEFGIDSLLEEDLGNQYEKAVFMDGFDKEGHPVCYNVFGAFQDKELYQNCFADEEKRVKFLRWRIQFLEKSIRNLDFSPNGICTIVQVNDLKNSPGPAKRELRQATNQALAILQDNYPEFVAKQIFINVQWWYLAFNKMISPFLTQRTKSKFVFAGPSKSAETLFKYIAAEQVPVQYGGLSKGDQEFSISDSVTEVTIKPATKHTVEFSFSERCLLVWELRVVGWDVNYGAEFVPSTEDGYTVIVSKARKVSPSDEPVIFDTFKISEPGKVVLTIDNQTSKKKKLLYRSKTKPLSE